MPSIEILRLETVNGDQNTDLFNPYEDTITLRMTVKVSPDVTVASQPEATCTFQIISVDDNLVKFSTTQTFGIDPADEIISWVHAGIADQIGLIWGPCSVFAFRGVAQLSLVEDQTGFPTTAAFDVADLHWFQFEQLYEL